MTTYASSPRRKLAAILMVDVSGFSRMMGRNEEGTTQGKMRDVAAFVILEMVHPIATNWRLLPDHSRSSAAASERR